MADDCVLLNDIDCSDSRTANPKAGFPGTYYGFQPIGTNASPFTGTFDGGGFKLSNLYINRPLTGDPRSSYVGLFGRSGVANGNIHDLTIENADITGYSFVGVLAGQIDGTAGNLHAVTDVKVDGVLTCTSNTGYAGGVSANMSYCASTDCFASVAITHSGNFSSATYVGGFVGASSGSTYTTCISGASITTTGTGAGSPAIGGFVGGSTTVASTYTSCHSSTAIIDGFTGTGSSLSQLGGFAGFDNISSTYIYCYAVGTVASTNPINCYAGGFGGTLTGNIDQCYSTGSVVANSATNVARIGGFIGSSTATIDDCYARGDCCLSGIGSGTYALGGFLGVCAGAVTQCYSVGYVDTSAAKYGGFIGDYSSGATTGNFWDTTTSGTTNGTEGSNRAGVTGNDTDTMKTESTFTDASWDFNSIWDITTYTQPAVSQSNLTVWPSATGNYEDFEEGTLDAEAFVVVIPSTNEIKWIDALESLIVGTAADEWKIASNKLDTPLSPTNFGVKRQSTYGSTSIYPATVNEVLLFVDFVGRKVREMTWSADVEKYISPDMTSLAEHITVSGITCIAHQKNPDSMLWCVLGDGSLISMVYDREQNVIAWSDHIIDGTVQSVCVTPGTNEDEVWISVSRTNGVFIEKMTTRITAAIEDSFYVDSGIIDTGVSKTISGLDHLEGETVAALVDGSYDGTFTVSGGEITLATTPTAQTIVGLPYTALLQPMRIVENTQSGTSLGALTRVDDLTINFLNTLGAKYGPDSDNLFSVNFSDERLENADYITGLYSCDVPVTMPGGFSRENPILIVSDKPLPMTVRCIIAGFKRTGN